MPGDVPDRNCGDGPFSLPRPKNDPPIHELNRFRITATIPQLKLEIANPLFSARFEKEFDGVNDVFELQVCSSTQHPCQYPPSQPQCLDLPPIRCAGYVKGKLNKKWPDSCPRYCRALSYALSLHHQICYQVQAPMARHDGRKLTSSNLAPAAQPQQRLRLRSRSLPYRRRCRAESRPPRQRLCHRHSHLRRYDRKSFHKPDVPYGKGRGSFPRICFADMLAHSGIKAKVENKGQYEQYLAELKPLRDELGVPLKEDIYPEEKK